MPKWDYAVLTTSDEDGRYATLVGIDLAAKEEYQKKGRVQILALLDQLGDRGWELVAVQEVAMARRYIFTDVTHSGPQNEVNCRYGR